MNRLRFTYGFKGPERDELLRKSMLNNQDKVQRTILSKNVLRRKETTIEFLCLDKQELN
jgi:hypothetical protein